MARPAPDPRSGRTRPAFLGAFGQLADSSATSLNQVAATFKRETFEPGTVNLDYGGGRFEKATEFLAERDVANLVFDPFNRSAAHNLAARLALARAGGAHTVTANNLLNVIDDDRALAYAVAQCAAALRPGGTAFFLIHEGDRTGTARDTPRGHQRNARARDYLSFARESFGTVEVRSNLLRARDPKPDPAFDSLFSADSVERDALAEARRAKVPGRSGAAGKLIGGRLYVARESSAVLDSPAFRAACERLALAAGDGFEWRVAKSDPGSGTFSFIASPDWESADEPTVGDSWMIRPDGSARRRPAPARPEIYHHKWSFHRRGEAPFDETESIVRSVACAGLQLDRSRIGHRDEWEAQLSAAGFSWPPPGARVPAEAAPGALSRARPRALGSGT